MKTDRLNALTDGSTVMVAIIVRQLGAMVIVFRSSYAKIAIYFAVASLWLVPDMRFGRLVG